MFSEFKTFILRGNVMDLAVGVIIGAAFGKIVTALTDDLIMPVISSLTGGIDFSGKFIMLGSVPAKYKGSLDDYAALKKAGVAMIGYGDFISVVINFVILAFIIFLMVKMVNKLMPPAEAAVAGPSEEVQLLTQIRDSLKK